MHTLGAARVVVIGASAGGVEALLKLIPGLPSDLQAAVLIVVHTSPRAKSLLPTLLRRAGHLPAKYPTDGEEMQPSNIYVAPPDKHLIIDGNRVWLGNGPRENMSRPAIDPLFRSAAASFDGKVIGVVLSGMLDDGTAGLAAIKAAGGIAIVQDPDETVFKGMPFHAIENVSVDYVASAARIAEIVVELCKNSDRTNKSKTKNFPVFETLSSYICPECGGPLSENENENILQFRCRVGHMVSPESLMSGQSQTIERALWSAIRALQERADFSDRLAERMRKRDVKSAAAERYIGQARKARSDADVIHDLLLKRQDIDDTGDVHPPPHSS